MSENDRQKDDLLDRETRDYIHSKLNPEDPALEGFGEVVQRARKKATSSKLFLQESSSEVMETVHKLSTFLQAPRGWFLDLCLGHELTVPLVPTFPAQDPCEEVQKAAGDTLRLQLCVDDFHVPARLFVREIRVRRLCSQGCGDSQKVSDSSVLRETSFSGAEFHHAVCGTVSPSGIQRLTVPVELAMGARKPTKKETRSSRSYSKVLKKTIPATCQSESCFPSSLVNSGSAVAGQKFDSGPSAVLSPSDRTLGQMSHNTSTKDCITQISQPMSSVSLQEAPESTQSRFPGSTKSFTVPDDPRGSVSHTTSSQQSFQIDPMSFTPEIISSKDFSQNARLSAQCRPPPHCHSKITDMENGHDFMTANRFSDPRTNQKISNKGFQEQEDTSFRETRPTESALTDVRVVRESKEALVPELSKDRVMIQGHYINTVSGQALPFTVFVHRDLHVQEEEGPSQCTLNGSYVRAMLTVQKNLRWRFQHTV